MTKKMIECKEDGCPITFKWKKNMLRHYRQEHQDKMIWECPYCDKVLPSGDKLQQHQAIHTKRHGELLTDDNQPHPKLVKISSTDTATIYKWSKAMKGYHTSYQIDGEDTSDVKSHILKHRQSVMDILGKGSPQRSAKVQLILDVKFNKPLEPSTTIEAHFTTNQELLTAGTNSDELLDGYIGQLERRIDEFTREGSGWTVRRITHLDIHTAEYRPLVGSTYIPLPAQLKNRKAIINVQNNNKMCFMWSILAGLYPVDKDPQRVSKYIGKANELKWNGVKFPVSIKDVPKVEVLNEININVYGYENEFEVLHISNHTYSRTVNLMLVISGEKQHYCLIKDLDRLLSTQRSHEHKKYYCHKCLVPCYSEVKKEEHRKYCNSTLQRIKMPKEPICTFKNMHKMQKRPYVIYADFECITAKLNTCSHNPKLSYTNNYQRHEPSCYGLIGILDCGHNRQIESPEVYRGPGPVNHFITRILEKAEEYQKIRQSHRGVQNRIEGLDNTDCHICREPLIAEDVVVDHCHVCGKPRGLVHSRCNLKYSLDRDIVIGFHNLRRYDGHLIMQKIGKECTERGLSLECIPKGMEDYLSFTIVVPGTYRIRFIDTLQFLPNSLEQLAHITESTPILETTYEGEQLKLMKQKGVYPYDYVDCCDRFNETTLPPKESFKSLLTGDEITDEEYNRADNVWKVMKIETLGEYTEVYLLTDVLLLADVFENFRNFSLQNYSLDPTHYYTLPSLSWDACLKYTGVELELFTDPDMYTFMEKEIRGGMSTIIHRYAKANNPYLEGYDNSKDLSYIMNLDMNNLYGTAMVDKLPTGGFRWVDSYDLESTEEGYILEVDLDYPEDLHELHNDYPLAPEKINVTVDMVSTYTRSTGEVMNTTKLIPNLQRKENYIVHYQNLKYYLSQGLQLTKVYRILAFNQENWMAPYINFNTMMRSTAKNTFEKDLFKQLNNACFGKTMENVRKYVNIELVTDPERYRKLVANPRYERAQVFDEHLIGVSMRRPSVNLCKPVYVGFTVLELSKLYMHQFHYDHMKKQYQKSIKLLFTDTDSLCYLIHTRDIYKDMLKNIHLDDTSDYPEDDRGLHSNTNRKRLGVMKDETNGKPISEFVGLRSKMYSLLTGNEEKKALAKGIVKNVRHAHYLQVLNTKVPTRHIMNVIRSDRHEIYSMTVQKVGLSAYDDKRYILNDGVTTLAYGHVKILSE